MNITQQELNTVLSKINKMIEADDNQEITFICDSYVTLTKIQKELIRIIKNEKHNKYN